MRYTLDDIITLAKDVELGDGIDWTDINADRDKIYQIIGSQVYDYYHQANTAEDGEAIMLATITKLVVENFILNIRLQSDY